MKTAFAFVVGCLVVLMVSASPQYTTKYDNVDVDAILKNPRLVDHYCDCLLDKRPCPPDGEVLKEIMPDAIKTECAKCNEKQKATAEKVIRFLIEKKHEVWTELKQKYDPEGLYKDKYAAVEEEAAKKIEAEKTA